MKHVYKRIPFDIYEIENIESAMSSFSEKGLHPVGVYRTTAFVKCKKGDAVKSRVRLEPMRSNDDELPDELFELYEASGWQYLGVMSRFYHVFITYDSSAPEPYSNEDFHMELFSRITRRSRHELIYCAVILAVCIGIICLSAAAKEAPLLGIVNDGLWRIVYLAVLLILLAIFQIKHVVSISRLHKRLKNGLSPQRNRRFSVFGMTLRQFSTALIIILCIGWYVMLFASGSLASSRELTRDDRLPFPTLYELSPEAEPGGFEYRGVDYANLLSVKRDLVVTKSWDLLQYDGGNVSLKVKKYECKVKWINRRLAQELAQGIVTVYEDETVWQDGEYYIKYYRDKNDKDAEQYLSIFTDKCAAYVVYKGESDLSAFAEAFAGL